MLRKIHNGGRRINVCKLPSQKNGRNIWTESIAELCLALRCEHDRNVISYSTQSIRVFYELNGKRRSFTADFLVYRKQQRPLIVEVKYERLITPWFEQLFRIVTPICDRAGYDFLVKTEREILVEPFLTTIKRLRYYSRTSIHPQHQLLCHEFFLHRQTATLGELFELFESRGAERPVVLALMYHHFIVTDYLIPLSVKSPIWLPTDSENNDGGEG